MQYKSFLFNYFSSAFVYIVYTDKGDTNFVFFSTLFTMCTLLFLCLKVPKRENFSLAFFALSVYPSGYVT
jgi:hypothetical protein